MNQKLTVFDLGMHNGDDTSYYLERGFRVVAVEANAELCDHGRDRFRQRIRNGDLFIVNKAVAECGGGRVEFFISSLNTEWSTVRRCSEVLGDDPKRVLVETTTLHTLISEYGLPHYIKCDLEGSDVTFCRQLAKEKEKPDFVSVEGTALEVLALLASSGYDTFQLINNAKVRRFPSRKSFDNRVYGDARATIAGHCSGEFGFDLAPDKWIPFKEASYRWLKIDDLHTADPSTTLDSWFDFHATTGTVLNGRAAHGERSSPRRRPGGQGPGAPDDRESRIRILRQALEDRDRTLARRDDEIAALTAKLEESSRALEESSRALEDRDRTLARRGGEIAALTAKIEESNRLLTERHGEIMALVGRLEALWNSRSWRLTRPLRAVKRLLYPS